MFVLNKLRKYIVHKIEQADITPDYYFQDIPVWAVRRLINAVDYSLIFGVRPLSFTYTINHGLYKVAMDFRMRFVSKWNCNENERHIIIDVFMNDQAIMKLEPDITNHSMYTVLYNDKDQKRNFDNLKKIISTCYNKFRSKYRLIL
jgi:hypothetical protein